VQHCNEAVAAQRRQALGRAIRWHREPQTQSAMALALGVSQSLVSLWEAGLTELSVTQVAAIEDYLGAERGTLLVEAGFVSEKLAGGGAAHAVARLDEAITCLVATLGSPKR